ncbi:nitrite reductase [Burkholderia sp. HI2761]|uniref:nitrite reductase (NAD(P)H) small subunit n=1 Tax=unclassified Burkholderia TaxID=2613784 RepID=UPI000B7A3AB5|nr:MULTISPECIES: nitrite reductase (NAD(P)H) small subunit [unclassified Burkholderia]MPV59491.1 Rieske 2Fe-2S domain-containing protein [Burkholderia sp. BE24]OXJ23348.1 nitrite reductase [Burkholderia sp. HI2761]
MTTFDPDWITVCRIDDIPPLGARVVKRPEGAPVALFRTAGDRVFALLDRCPHRGGPLSQGIVHGEQVTCPLHGFNIAFGNGCALPPDDGGTPVFSVACDGDAVLLRRSELASLATGDDASGASACTEPGHAA